MKAKKVTLITLSLLLIALLLASCKKKEGAPPTPTPTPPKEGEAAPAKATATYTPTPEEKLCLEACAPITADNIGQLQRLAHLNKGRITDIATSPDNKELAVAVGIGVYIYDTQTLQELQFISDGTSMQSVAYSPNGTDLAIGSLNRVYLYAGTASPPYEKRDTITGPFDIVSDLVYAHNGNTLGVVDGANAYLVDISSKEYLPLYHWQEVDGLSFSPDDAQVFTSSGDGLHIWNANTGEEAQSADKPAPCGWRYRLTDLPGTDQTVTTCRGLLQIIAGTETFASNEETMVEDIAEVTSIVGNPAGDQHFAIGRADGSMDIWNANDLTEPVWQGYGHPDSVVSMAYLPDGTALFSASDTEVIKWNAITGKELGRIEGFSTSISDFGFLPDMTMLSATKFGIWKHPTDICYGQLSTPSMILEFPEELNAASISPSGYYASGYWLERQETQKVYHVPIFGIFEEAQADITFTEDVYPHHMTMSPNDTYLAIPVTQTVQLYDYTGGYITTLQDQSEWINTIAVNSDGSQLATADYMGTINIWDLGTYSLVNTWMGYPNYPFSMVYSPDGNSLAISYEGGNVDVGQLTDGYEATSLVGHTEGVYGMDFSPDGRILVTGSYDRTVRFWDVQSGDELYWMTLPGFPKHISFSPDGNLLAIITNDSIINLFGIPCESVAASAEHPTVNPGPMPTPTPKPVSPLCSIVLQPPEGQNIKYALEDGTHKFYFPPGTIPDPRKTILWSNMSRGTWYSSGEVMIEIPESQAIVEYDETTGSISVQIPHCNRPRE